MRARIRPRDVSTSNRSRATRNGRPTTRERDTGDRPARDAGIPDERPHNRHTSRSPDTSANRTASFSSKPRTALPLVRFIGERVEIVNPVQVMQHAVALAETRIARLRGRPVGQMQHVGR